MNPILTAILNFIVSQIGSILGITQAIQASTAHTAQETTPYLVQIDVANINSTVHDINWGLPALHAQLTAIQTAIGTRQSGSTAVILPSTPPSGYGANNNAIADAVWHYLVGGYTAQAGDLMLDAGLLAVNLGTAGARFPHTLSKYYELKGTWFSTAGAAGVGSDPVFPLANIHPTDTLHTFLERESFYTGWTANDDGTESVSQDPAHTDFVITTTITAAEFIILRDGAAPGAAALVPPIWPGIAKVTLGTPLALSNGLTVPGPLDGVIIDITSVAYPAPFYLFGTHRSFSKIGGIIFVDDNGQAERQDYVGLEDHVVCPRQMVHADHAILRLQSGVTGTVTPWTTP